MSNILVRGAAAMATVVGLSGCGNIGGLVQEAKNKLVGAGTAVASQAAAPVTDAAASAVANGKARVADAAASAASAAKDTVASKTPAAICTAGNVVISDGTARDARGRQHTVTVTGKNGKSVTLGFNLPAVSQGGVDKTKTGISDLIDGTAATRINACTEAMTGVSVAQACTRANALVFPKVDGRSKELPGYDKPLYGTDASGNRLAVYFKKIDVAADVLTDCNASYTLEGTAKPAATRQRTSTTQPAKTKIAPKP